MKHLIQILLPTTAHDPAQFEQLARELTEKFGGVTSFIRAPAEGRWQSGEKTELDDIAVIEVMTDFLDRAYWADLRRRLEEAFAQEEIVVRCQPLELL
jgi:hypothetical protein